MSLKKLTFNLVQHTPILHFQPFLESSTLRATELKPKLDKFLAYNLIGQWIDKNELRFNKLVECGFSKWLKSEGRLGQPAFDYNIKILSSKNSNIDPDSNRDKPYSGYFGNMWNSTDVSEKNRIKEFLINPNPIELTIFTHHDGLRHTIENCITEFFFLHNFGTRQSKGFGSFYLSSTMVSNRLNGQVLFPYYYDLQGSFDELFKSIDLLYRSLRSGINSKNRQGTVLYFKSLMWAYAKSKEAQWDKKTIKNAIYGAVEQIGGVQHTEYNRNIENDEEGAHWPIGFESNQSEYLWRDLLGLSSLEQWKAPNQRGEYKLNRVLTKVNVNDQNIEINDVKRFKSPIFFKPIQTSPKNGTKRFRVFMGVLPWIKDEFLNPENRIEGNESEVLGKKMKVKYDGRNQVTLQFPRTFDYMEFLDFAIRTFNDESETWVDEEYHNKRDYKTICSIYNQLGRQINQ